jgi:hypothetical protein
MGQEGNVTRAVRRVREEKALSKQYRELGRNPPGELVLRQRRIKRQARLAHARRHHIPGPVISSIRISHAPILDIPLAIGVLLSNIVPVKNISRHAIPQALPGTSR